MDISQQSSTRVSAWSAALVVGAWLLAGAVPAWPIEPPPPPHPQAGPGGPEGQQAVDHAWEIYHKAALGGTIASPAVQANIEQHLHDARALVPQAHVAAERGDMRRVEGLVAQIRRHSNVAIQESMEHKR